jgi:excisionase family DNA binding protein
MAEAITRKNLTLKEAAAWYGVSERTLRRRIAEGRLRAYRVGPRSIRVTAEDVEALATRIPTTVPAA